MVATVAVGRGLAMVICFRQADLRLWGEVSRLVTINPQVTGVSQCHEQSCRVLRRRFPGL